MQRANSDTKNASESSIDICEHQPGDLDRLRVYDAFETSNEFLTQIDHASDTIHPAAYETSRPP